MADMTWANLPGWFDYADHYDDVAAGLPDDGVAVEVGVFAGLSVAYLNRTAEERKCVTFVSPESTGFPRFRALSLQCGAI